jgi:hypothetical protein
VEQVHCRCISSNLSGRIGDCQGDRVYLSQKPETKLVLLITVHWCEDLGTSVGQCIFPQENRDIRAEKWVKSYCEFCDVCLHVPRAVNTS